jgi:hypothetical protein
MGLATISSCLPPKSRRALRLGGAAEWFAMVGDAPQDLRRRRSLRALLVAFVERRRCDPGGTFTVDDLVAIGWPGERVLPTAGANRVYVALSTLRSMGLRRCLISRRGGYLLDPEVEVEQVPSAQVEREADAHVAERDQVARRRRHQRARNHVAHRVVGAHRVPAAEQM